MILQSHSWASIQRKLWLAKTHVLQCSLQHYFKYPRHGNHLNVPRQRSESRRCGTYTQWNNTQQQNNSINSIMDQLEILMLWSKSERVRQTPYDITYMWNLKYCPTESIYKTETGSSYRGLAVMNLNRIHEDAGLIPGLAQWVKDPVLPWAVV